MDAIGLLNNAVFTQKIACGYGCSSRLLITNERVSSIETPLVNIVLQKRKITETFIAREREVNFFALLNGISDDKKRKLIGNVVEQLLENNPIKTTLNLTIQSIGSDGFAVLVKALEKNGYLQILQLSHNDLGDDASVTMLAEVIKKNQSLQILDFSHNSIGDKGAVMLAEALRENQSLQILNLSDNSIGDKGAVMLAEALRENQTLQSLNLACNHISDEGVSAFVNALKENRSLYFLDLSDNDIYIVGAEALLKLLKKKLIVASCRSFNSCKKPTFTNSGEEAISSCRLETEVMKIASKVRGDLRAFRILNCNLIIWLYKKKETIDVITNQLQNLKQKLCPLDEFFSVRVESTSVHCSDFTGKVVEDFEAYVSCLHELMKQIAIMERMVLWEIMSARCYGRGYLNKTREKEMNNLPNHLQNLLLSEFEDILSAICSKYYHLYYKNDFALFNIPNGDLACDIYRFWERIFEEKCPKWLDSKIEQLDTFYQLWALVEGRKEESDTCLPPSIIFPILKEMSEKKCLSEPLLPQEAEESKRRRLV